MSLGGREPWEEDVESLLNSEARGVAADEARDEALRRATPLIERVIRDSFANTGFPREELFRPGYLGLLNAVYNYDLSRGQSFREYAEHLIKGEVRSHIRERAERDEAPRWMTDLNRQLEKAQARLLRERGRLPTLAELAEAVNITEEGISEIFKARDSVRYVSLDAGQRVNDPDPQIDLEKIRGLRPTAFPIEHRIRIAAALEKLADLQQTLFRHLFDANAGADGTSSA